MKQIQFFFCPASDYLNQFNETGSHGQISYQFLKHLAKRKEVKHIFALTIKSLSVAPVAKTDLHTIVNNSNKKTLTPFDSLRFYLESYIRFRRSEEYKEASIIHHIIPFSFGRSFNLFFIFKNKKKKYIIGPIIGPHISADAITDEEYVFRSNLRLVDRFKKVSISLIRDMCLFIFSKLLWYFSVKTLQNADIVFFSDNHARNFHSKYMRKTQKALLLDTGINTDVFKPKINTKINKETDPLKILFVGRLTKRKGCEYLIKAIADALQMQPNLRFKCTISGIGPLKNELENLANELDVRQYVYFKGGVKSNEDLVSRYHQADIVCLPALSETFTVTKEALCSGIPVIVTNICSNAERIEEGVNGFIVPPRDSQAIAKVLIKLATSKQLLKQLSVNSSKCEPLYNWDNIIENYIINVKSL